MKHIALVLLLILSSSFTANFVFADDITKDKPMSPKWQMTHGVSLENILCANGLVLMKKVSDNSPACVKSQTAQNLTQYGWGVILSRESKIISQVPVNASNGSFSQGTVDASNRFTFSFFSNVIQKENDNVFFSPYSISNAFSMVYEGAHGKTKDEIQSIFNFIQNDVERRDSVKATNSGFNNPNNNYTLNIANALWVETDFQVLKDYADTLEKYYSAKATNLDFKSSPEGSRQMINGWVEDKTNQKIKDLISTGSITPDTKVVLTNAVYFKGNWSHPFDVTLTKDDNFKTTNQKVVKIPMMKTEGDFNYFGDDGLQVLEMPYQGNLSMIVLLPKENNLKSLTDSLSQEKLNEWKNKLIVQQVIVYMPKFNFTTYYVLNGNLISMGMPTAFSKDYADFSGITGKKDLYIDLAIHKAFVKIDEKGSEAAAATAIIMMPTAACPGCGEPHQPPIFRADHPFTFFIYDNQNGLILFMGQVADPSAG